MPNWCENKVSIEGDPSEIKRFYDAAVKGEFLQAVCPMPKCIPPITKGVGLGSLPDWYNWRLQNWGCKWDIGTDGQADMVSPNILMLTFDSAWSPPIQAYEKLVEEGFEVVASYHEGGMCFIGTFEAGEDSCVEYDELGDIPDHLSEIWDMKLHFAMMEEELADEE